MIVVGFYIAYLVKDLRSSNNVKLEEAALSQGIEAIKKLEEESDISQIESKINSIKMQNGAINQDNTGSINTNSKKVDYKSKFSSTVIAGDSRAEGFSVYGYLPQTSVVAYKGRNVSTIKQKGDVARIISLSPKNVIFVYGINDILANSNSDKYINSYGEVIDELKQKLPNTRLYICGILPVQAFAAKSRPNYYNIPAWNEELKKLCSEKQINYLDASSILLQSDYEQDGVHFKGSFQKKWLDFFIQQLGL